MGLSKRCPTDQTKYCSPNARCRLVVAAKGGKFSGAIGRREQLDGAAVDASNGGGLSVLETVAESLMVLCIESVVPAIVVDGRYPKRRKRTRTLG